MERVPCKVKVVSDSYWCSAVVVGGRLAEEGQCAEGKEDGGEGFALPDTGARLKGGEDTSFVGDEEGRGVRIGEMSEMKKWGKVRASV